MSAWVPNPSAMSFTGLDWPECQAIAARHDRMLRSETVSILSPEGPLQRSNWADARTSRPPTFSTHRSVL